MSETYNGWANHATWNVHLWLTCNDEPTYRAALDLRRAGWGAHFIARTLLGLRTPDGARIPLRRRTGPDGPRAETVRLRDAARRLRAEFPGDTVQTLADRLNAEAEPRRLVTRQRFQALLRDPAPRSRGESIDWDAIGAALDECIGGAR